MTAMNRREFVRRTALAAAHFSWPAMPDASARPVEFERIRLQTAKLDEMAEFYSKALSLRVKSSRGVLTVESGRSVLEFTAAQIGEPFYHFAFHIPENKLDQSIEWLRPRCPVFKNPANGQEIYHFVNWNAHSIYFHDPAGNILEFIARHTLSNASESPFRVADILSISEIAMVAPDLSVVADRLKSELGVPNYFGASPEFIAMGSEHALFILAKTGRRWLGGTSQAAVHPVEVELRSAQRKRLQWDSLPFIVR